MVASLHAGRDACRFLLIGDSAIISALAQNLPSGAAVTVFPVSRDASEREQIVQNSALTAWLQAAERLAGSCRSEVVLALDSHALAFLRALVECVRSYPVGLLLAKGCGRDSAPGAFAGGEPDFVRVIAAPPTSLRKLSKRVFDVAVAGLLLGLAGPLLLLTAAAVKLTSTGPVFFRQLRCGEHGKTFRVLKFRTFHHQACDAPDATSITASGEADRRLTPVGRFLRTRGLDEVPQIWNVLRGEMSIVGPRPYAVQEDVYYAARIDGYFSRTRVKPGITGWAQVNGLRGSIDGVEDMKRRLAFDLSYVDHAGVRLDLRVLLMSVRVVLFGLTSRRRSRRLDPAGIRNPALEGGDRRGPHAATEDIVRARTALSDGTGRLDVVRR